MTSAPVDSAVLERLRDIGGDDLVTDLIATALPSLRDRVNAAVAAAGRHDAGALQFQAHSLKSSAANIGARRLSRIAQEIEEHVRRGATDQAWALVTPLTEELPAVVRALEEMQICPSR